MIVPSPLCGAMIDLIEQHRRGNGNAKVLPPRQRLLDLIAFVRTASDDELEHMFQFLHFLDCAGVLSLQSPIEHASR